MTTNSRFLKVTIISVLTLFIFIIIPTLGFITFEALHSKQSNYDKAKLNRNALMLIHQGDALVQANKTYKHEHSHFAKTTQQLFDNHLIETIPSPTPATSNEYQLDAEQGHAILNKVPDDICKATEKLSTKHSSVHAECQTNTTNSPTLLFKPHDDTT